MAAPYLLLLTLAFLMFLQ